MTRGIYALLIVAVIVLLAGIYREPADVTGAVCTTDADCAAWEERMGIPEADRCYGAPCPAAR